MTPEFLSVPIGELRPNSWNPNEMDPETYAKEIESVHRFGFIDPITVRDEPSSTPWEIIDGENRWRVAQDHGACIRAKKGGGWERHRGLTEIPVANLGEVSTHVAEQLTVVLNELHGEYDQKKMGSLLTSLLAAESLPSLVEVLPFTKEEFADLAELPQVDWGAIPDTGSKVTSESWAERVYRLPREEAERLDSVVQKIRDQEGCAAWQAVIRLVEHYQETA